MRVLITGGAGFIGSHLAELLLRDHNSVDVLDDLSTGSIENVRHLFAHPGFLFHHGSIFNQPLLAALIDRCDVIYHLAASVGVKLIVEQPVESIATNVAGTEQLLRLAAHHRRRVILASSSEVYGKSTQLPFREDGDLVLGAVTQSRWSGACSKAIDEFLAIAWYRQNRLPVTIVRLFNTVGPRQTGRHGMVLPTFVRQALLGQPLTIYGSGEQSRCFAHVTDIVEALHLIAPHTETIGEVYNLGGTTEITIRRLSQLVSQATGSASEILHIPYEQAYAPGFEDIQRCVPDISKAQAAFGFQPRRGISHILDEVIADQRERLEALRSGQLQPRD